LSPNEPSHLASSRRKLIGIKSQKNLDEFAWKHDSSQNVLRRRDGVTGKFVHAKVDWIADPKRKFLKAKQEEKILKEDEEYVQKRKKDFEMSTEEDGKQTLPSDPPKQMWRLPVQELNRGAPSLVHEYGREEHHMYTHEQRKALSEIRARAFEHEKKRMLILSQGAHASSDLADQDFWDYEKNLRSPLYDFFRGAQIVEECSVSDARCKHKPEGGLTSPHSEILIKTSTPSPLTTNPFSRFALVRSPITTEIFPGSSSSMVCAPQRA
jgi:hypothetical protein